MNNKINEKIKSVEKTLHFAIGLSLFFPVLIEAMLGYSGLDTKEISRSILTTSITIFLFIINYLFFEWRKDKLSNRQLDYLRISFIVSVICFASLTLLLGLMASRDTLSLDWFGSFSLLFVLMGVMVFPLIGIIIMFINFLIEFSKK